MRPATREGVPKLSHFEKYTIMLLRNQKHKRNSLCYNMKAIIYVLLAILIFL